MSSPEAFNEDGADYREEEESESEVDEFNPRVPQIFTGRRICLIYDLMSAGNYEVVSKLIEKHGGDPNAEEEDAEVIVFSSYKNPALFRKLRRKYVHNSNIWVEEPGWVKRCVRDGRYYHDAPVFESLRGRKTTSLLFNDEDDEHLIDYLAHRIPVKEHGGRSGQKVYKELVDHLELYPWADRHPWSSWLERYKKRAIDFDERISVVVREKNIEPFGKGTYRYKRKEHLGEYARGVGYRRIDDEEEEGEEEEVEAVVEAEIQQQPRRQPPRPTTNANRTSRPSGVGTNAGKQRANASAALDSPGQVRKEGSEPTWESWPPRRKKTGVNRPNRTSPEDPFLDDFDPNADGPGQFDFPIEDDQLRPPSPTLVNPPTQTQWTQGPPPGTAGSSRATRPANVKSAGTPVTGRSRPGKGSDKAEPQQKPTHRAAKKRPAPPSEMPRLRKQEEEAYDHEPEVTTPEVEEAEDDSEEPPATYERVSGAPPPSDNQVVSVSPSQSRRKLSQIPEMSEDETQDIVEVDQNLHDISDQQIPVPQADPMDIDIDIDDESIDSAAMERFKLIQKRSPSKPAVSTMTPTAAAVASPALSRHSRRSSAHQAISGWVGDRPVLDLENPSIAPQRNQPAVAVRNLRSGSTAPSRRKETRQFKRESSAVPIPPSPITSKRVRADPYPPRKPSPASRRKSSRRSTSVDSVATRTRAARGGRSGPHRATWG